MVCGREKDIWCVEPLGQEGDQLKQHHVIQSGQGIIIPALGIILLLRTLTYYLGITSYESLCFQNHTVCSMKMWVLLLVGSS